MILFKIVIFNVLDDGEIFQVKKSSQSRRLIKQLKAEKKAAKKNGGGVLPAQYSPTSLSRNQNDSTSTPSQSIPNTIENDLDIRFNDSIKKKSRRKEEITSWTVAGKEAEALHMEEEDSDENSNEDDEIKDPLQKMLQSG